MSNKRSRNAFEEPSSRELSFVTYGTALPPSDSSRDDGSYVPVWKQEVTDERGRKRLHGAFTGGFSAGYFNTVGSKEGWTPATFTSSRKARAKASDAKPEDFMDAEDLREAEEAKQLETNQNLLGVGSNSNQDRGVLDELLVPPTQETMGCRLLRKMGWKDGQGIGPRSLREAQTSDQDSHAHDESDGKTYLFAPANTPMISFAPKNNSMGLGFSPEKPLEAVPEADRATSPQKEPKRKLGGGAFGVGVLNDDGEDDEDPYEIRPKTLYNKTIGGKPAKRTPKAGGPIRPVKGKHVFVPKKVSSDKTAFRMRKCSDGRLPLPGFILSTVETALSATYEFPVVPDDWGVESGTSTSLVTSAASMSLDSRGRGNMLGESPLPGKSVFDFLTPEARNRIVSMTGKSNLPPALGEAPAPSKPSSMADLVPHLDEDVAQNALSGGFMPYSDDPEKLARYVTYLEIKSGQRTGLPDRKYGMNNHDWVKEMNEFAGAARIFRPLAGSMANRFTSSKASSAFQGNIGKDTNDNMETLIHRPSEKPADTAEEAAKLSMYGPLTRQVFDFVPSRLLCKRLNVRPPAVHETPVEPPAPKGSSFVTPVPQSGQPAPQPLAEIEEAPTIPESKAVDADINHALEEDKAAHEVFQAIFGDGDD